MSHTPNNQEYIWGPTPTKRNYLAQLRRLSVDMGTSLAQTIVAYQHNALSIANLI
jgi:hypothetical protein